MPNPGKISPDLIGTCPWFEDRVVEAANMGELMSADPKRVMDALLTMGRIDIAALREAGSGVPRHPKPYLAGPLPRIW